MEVETADGTASRSVGQKQIIRPCLDLSRRLRQGQPILSCAAHVADQAATQKQSLASVELSDHIPSSENRKDLQRTQTVERRCARASGKKSWHRFHQPIA